MGFADDLEDAISRGQLMQFAIFVLINLSFIGVYVLSIILNGMDATNAWITTNVFVVAYAYSFAVAILPVYSRLDDRTRSALKQFTSAALIIGGASLVLSVYSFWAVDPTPFQEAVFWFAKRVFGVTFFGVFTAVVLVKNQ